MTGIGAPTLLMARGVTARYPEADAAAVRGVDLSLAAGESVGLVGASGCGKTTLVRALLGLLPFDGRIEWGGRSVLELLAADPTAFRSRVQLLLQAPVHAFDPRRRIGAEVGAALRRHGRNSLGVAAALRRVGLPESYGDRLPHTLSGGELQRAALARALAVEPEVLILDEALVSLDPVSRSELADLLSDLQQKSNLTYLHVAHDLGMIGALCSRIAVMDEGRIVDVGETSEVLTGSRDPVTRDLIAASPMWKGA